MRKLFFTTAILMVLAAALLLTGCNHSGAVRPQSKSQFDQNIEDLVMDTVAASRARVPRLAPAAIVSKSVLNNKYYSRLDEIVLRRLESKLSSEREIVNLSRENWFELREGKPLSLKGHSYAHSDLIEDSLVYIVDVEPDEVLEQIQVSIYAKDADSRSIPGLKAQTMLDYGSKSPGTLLLNEPAKSNPLPPGLKENPYASLEQLAYSLASELQASLKRGVTSGRYKASDDEIQVVLCSSSFISTDPRFKNALIQELQQALVSMDGMTSSVSQEDFAPIFQQINFYKRNKNLFELDNERFKPGSVLLMAETKSHAYKDLKQVALRAVWRVTPLKDDQGQFIAQNSAGSYVSGFTSRAWFDGDIPTVIKKTPYRPRQQYQGQQPQKKFDSQDSGFE